MAMLGYMYETGKGVEKDLAQAVSWYSRGAERSDAVGVIALARLMAAGYGIAKDEGGSLQLLKNNASSDSPSVIVAYARALLRNIHKPALAELAQILRPCIETQYAPALFVMGAEYLESPTATEAAIGVEHLRIASALSYVPAVAALGKAYYFGKGVSRDYSAALMYYERASRAGHVSSMHNFGALLDSGRAGGSKQPVRAATLVYNAVRFGNEFSYKQLKGNAAGYSLEFRRHFQALLKADGHYSGTLDGEFGAATISALDRLFAMREGA
jgi:TPR repeat protein